MPSLGDKIDPKADRQHSLCCGIYQCSSLVSTSQVLGCRPTTQHLPFEYFITSFVITLHEMIRVTYSSNPPNLAMASYSQMHTLRTLSPLCRFLKPCLDSSMYHIHVTFSCSSVHVAACVFKRALEKLGRHMFIVGMITSPKSRANQPSR